jgi:hypothetical protein
MKLFFIIIYTVISTRPTPCPDAGKGEFFLQSCGVYHGMTRDTLQVEVMTTDTARVNTLLRDYPAAKVDTFLLTPFIRG